MSDILIKGMEMPQCCIECPLLLAYRLRHENKTIYYCTGRVPKDLRFSEDADLTKRPNDCPLVEVKEVKFKNSDDALKLYSDEKKIWTEASE